MKRMIFICLLSLLFTLVDYPTENQAASFFVVNIGYPTNDCSRLHPCALSRALELAEDGDTIYLAAGLYDISSLIIKKSIILLGGWIGDTHSSALPVPRDPKKYTSILNGGGSCRVITLQGSPDSILSPLSPTIDGFTITSYAIIDPSGFFMQDAATNGCGIYADKANPTISHNIFQNIQGSSVVALVDSSGTLDGNQFIGNLSPGSSGSVILVAVQSNSLVSNPLYIVNNILINNPQSGVDATGIRLDSDQKGLLSTEIAYNTLTGLSTGIELLNEADAVASFNIFAANTHSVGYANITALTGEHNLFYQNADDASPGVSFDSDPLSGDPAFVDPSGSDYHIRYNSAARRHGSCLPEVSHDIDGDPRPFPGQCDLGADQLPNLIFLPSVLS